MIKTKSLQHIHVLQNKNTFTSYSTGAAPILPDTLLPTEPALLAQSQVSVLELVVVLPLLGGVVVVGGFGVFGARVVDGVFVGFVELVVGEVFGGFLVRLGGRWGEMF